MRPHRVRLTHSLVKNYGLNKRLLVHRPQPRNDDELEMFHADGASRTGCEVLLTFRPCWQS